MRRVRDVRWMSGPIRTGRIRWALLLASVAFPILPQGAMAGSLFPAPPPGLRVTEFASGLNFPTSMTVLGDGSLLVGTTPSSALGGFQNFYLGSGQLVRFSDTSNTGIALSLIHI